MTSKKPGEELKIIKTYLEANVCEGSCKKENCETCVLTKCLKDLESIEKFDKYIGTYTDSFANLIDACCELVDDEISCA